MVTREQITNFLKVNHVPSTATEDEVRQALMYAHWNVDDVNYALQVLAGTAESAEVLDPQVALSRHLMHTNTTLAPESISSLLGIDVSLTKAEATFDEKPGMFSFSETLRTFLQLLGGVIVAALVALVVMYYMKLGPFYVPFEQSIF